MHISGKIIEPHRMGIPSLDAASTSLLVMVRYSLRKSLFFLNSVFVPQDQKLLIFTFLPLFTQLLIGIKCPKNTCIYIKAFDYFVKNNFFNFNDFNHPRYLRASRILHPVSYTEYLPVAALF